MVIRETGRTVGCVSGIKMKRSGLMVYETGHEDPLPVTLNSQGTVLRLERLHRFKANKGRTSDMVDQDGVNARTTLLATKRAISRKRELSLREAFGIKRNKGIFPFSEVNGLGNRGI